VRPRKPLAAGLAVAAALGVGLTAKSLQPKQAKASSHAEAPLISQDPTADNTDLYAFVSPDKPNTVTIIANWIPKEDPANGPNFYKFSDTARYRINIDTDGDAVDDTSYQFRFTSHIRRPSFLYATGVVTSIDDPDLNQYQTYTITKVTGEGRKAQSTVIARDLPVPPVNVGPRTTPNYPMVAAQGVQPLPGGGKVFAGPRDDPFYVDLGGIFDLATIRKGLGQTGGGVDGLKGFNVHSIELQLPISGLVKPGHPTIGIYAATDRQRVTVTGGGKVTGRGAWQQVSRLGNPLVNEVIIPATQKDLWNSTEPEEDAQFDSFFLNSELAADLNLLYGPTGIVAHLFDPPLATTGRIDLLTVLETGVGPQVLPSLPALNYTGPTHADLLRLNTTIPPVPCGTENRMGVLGGDLAGFPNGRRLADDVVDIEEQAVAVAHPLDFLSGNQYKIGDGVDANDHPFTCSFPYAATPNQGFSYSHDPS
jgi:hypothetical protein